MHACIQCRAKFFSFSPSVNILFGMPKDIYFIQKGNAHIYEYFPILNQISHTTILFFFHSFTLKDRPARKKSLDFL